MYRLEKSSRKNKKFMILLPDGKKVHFGARGMSDYTKHHDDKRKERYLARAVYKPDVNSASFWARWVLWNKKTIDESLDDIAKRFGLLVAYDKKKIKNR
jgi:hypothetical protein